MQYRGVNELRELFLEFFEEKGCLRLPSFSLVPHNDDSLLIINSGMAPMKPWFTGQEIPPRRRVTTCQKCIRTGDLENVGKTARHGTYFEMLGNFSFGDYFKKEAIPWAWEFLTERVGLEPERLYPSVYVDDQEAYDIWLNDMHVPADHIYKFGKEDNFWEHGSGPCGPCTEIYYDRGEKYGNGPEDVMGGEGDRYMEVWNVVFSQFNNDGHGHYTDLVQKNIDTGMGLERLAVAVQDVGSIFDVDTLKSLRDLICRLAGGIGYEEPGTEVSDVSVRICTDHARAMTFMISDGIMPSNNGRGYVLRRIIRRAVRHGRKLGISGSFLPTLAENVIDGSKAGYPELEEKRAFILSVIRAEEEKFEKTYEQGMNILDEMIGTLKKEGRNELSGDDAFRLYDTYGFPIDNTKEILEESGLTVDEKGFEAAMKKQKDMAREDRKKSGKNSEYMGAAATVYEEMDSSVSSEFTGYDRTEDEGRIVALASLSENGSEDDSVTEALSDGEFGAIITDKTPFYGTMGGQVGDTGVITGPEGASFAVQSTIHVSGSKIAHIGTVKSGMFRSGETVKLTVDGTRRKAICANHSATHLLQKALREVLGTHVEQAGSYQDEHRTRFDFSHFQAMTPEEISRVEDIVNKKIAEDLPVVTQVMSLDDARKTGAMALFGEKYGDKVRVVKMGDFSIELCGGTHVAHTGQIRQFKILSESGVAAGVRRIEAITGDAVTEFYKEEEKKLHEAAALLKALPDSVTEHIRKLQDEIKALRAENESLKSAQAASAMNDWETRVQDVKGVKLLADGLKGVDMNGLRDLGDKIKTRLGEGVIVLVSDNDGKVSVMAMATDEAVRKGAHAGNLIRTLARFVGGGGGGRPQMAQAGGKNAAGIPDLIKAAPEELAKQLH
ncbi:MAG: alanine--tRNA ligase [Lachnospiraceae bacterium]|jgi:alanyl-tRNA synthetase|nr:alanine--tRNA ligase [Lachnospiraceae bacterium]MCH4030595.1 alanine--tRNA ligase [Lachnospiraceae bacterium]MCH4069804.1 alanine--tRNA ligase [Lachnospiraceae bacterium]MCH4107257.1 alanine--tRNA ligase [Lachnospiraceae bacterium]MCI1301888.1 alanine--tRNA ligase [Lachnospiraceae bacterium]